jgi:uncharacterized protein
MIERKEALVLMKENIANVNLQKHCLATEIFMKFLAKELNEDEHKWSLTGLLHDLDYVETAENPEKHSLIAAEMLEKIDVPEDVVYAVKVHNEIHNLPRKSLLDKALYAADPVTGLIVACALIKPEKKLRAIDVPFIMNRFNEKSFAKGANREQIASCEELGFSLEEFLEIGLESMQSIDGELGL